MTFEEILHMRQKELKHFLAAYLKEQGYLVERQNGFLYARGEIPVLLVAHLDTVHQEKPSIICRSEDRRYMMSPQGIGGDDRCGVYMILQILKEVRCHVLFCEDEETGGRGARAFAGSGIAVDVNYIVEMDRRGNNDAVFYSCDNPEFTEFVCSFGFEEASGSFSDISVIAPYLKTAAVNISAGYYNEHRQHEMIDCKAMENNIRRITQMATVQTEHFPYMERCCYFRQSSLFDNYFDWDFSAAPTEHKKLLMELPDGAKMVMNGHFFETSYEYLMDRDGNLYAYMPDIDMAVPTENSLACDEDGNVLKFSVENSKWISVVSMDTAIEQLSMF